MRITLYMLILLAIGSLAGLYQLDSLMVLLLTGIFLLILLLVSSSYLRGRMLAEFAKSQDVINQGEFLIGRIRLTNPTWLPVIHVKLWLEWENQMTGQRGKEVLQASCPPAADTVLEFVWEAEACGEIHFTLVKIETSDFFRLFKLRSRLKERTGLLVLPPEERIPWSLSAPSEGEEIGPYQHGDGVKHIHWKLSARMDDLLVRHYHALALPEAVLYLEPKIWPESEPEKPEAFLGRLSSVLLQLLLEGWTVRLLWNTSYLNEGRDENEDDSIKDKAQEWIECPVRTRADYLEAMGRVMEELARGRKKLPKKKGRFGAVLALYEKNEEEQVKVSQIPAEGEEIFLRLDFAGRLYLNQFPVVFEEME